MFPKQTDRRAKLLAENYSAKVGEAWDVEEDALRAEFAGVDLTDFEMADLHEAFRLRRRGSTNAERIASRGLFAAVRTSLREALKATIAHETGKDRLIRAMAVFDRDELAKEQALEIATIRPASDEDLARIRCQIGELVESRAERRQAIAREIEAGSIKPMSAKSDALRVHSRDGLQTLYDKRKINLRQMIAGRAYRRRWEAAFRGLQSVLAAPGRSPDVKRLVAMQERAAEWEKQRSRCDSAIVLRLRQYPDALMLLRRVAGDGYSLTSVVGNGSGFDRGVVRLVAALNVVADVLPFEDV